MEKEKVISAEPSVCSRTKKDKRKKKWQKPKLEDVSGRVMAQPYIRFT